MRPGSIVLPAAAIAAFLGFLGVVSWTAYHRKLDEAQARAEEQSSAGELKEVEQQMILSSSKRADPLQIRPPGSQSKPAPKSPQ